MDLINKCTSEIIYKSIKNKTTVKIKSLHVENRLKEQEMMTCVDKI